ncbi:hypothetical protein FWH09_02815 [Candidatus Saccharibacteria bacterium]|nr:hypothetical protein [Candidatus Saccharibacteria bacterium]
MIGNLSETEVSDFLVQAAVQNAWDLSVHKEIVDEKVLMLWRIKVGEENRNFLVVHKGTDPLRIDMRCNEGLSKMLQERFESVLPSKVMSPKEWVEIICSGQVTKEELLDLIRAAIELALA